MPRHGSCAPKLSDVLTGLFQSLIHNEIATAWTVTLDETLGSLGPHNLKSVYDRHLSISNALTHCA